MRDTIDRSGLPGQKFRLTKMLLSLRRDHPDLFLHGTFDAVRDGDVLEVRRTGKDAVLVLRMSPVTGVSAGTHWPQGDDPLAGAVAVSLVSAQAGLGAVRSEIASKPRELHR